MIIVVLTGGAEEEILNNAGRYNVLVAWPQYNSLPSALEAAAALRERGAFAYIIQVKSPENDPPLSKIRKFLGVISLFKMPPK